MEFVDKDIALFVKNLNEILQNFEVKSRCQHFSSLLPFTAYFTLLKLLILEIFKMLLSKHLPVLVRSPVANHGWRKSYSRLLSINLLLLRTTFKQKDKHQCFGILRVANWKKPTHTSAPSADATMNAGIGPIQNRVIECLFHVFDIFIKIDAISKIMK